MNYYYGLSFRQEDGANITLKFLQRLNQCRMYFFQCCVHAIEDCSHIDIKDSIARRTLLGIMDSIRDYLLILINIHLQEYAGSEDKLYLFLEKDQDLYELYSLAKQNLIQMYNCLFYNIDANFVQNFRDFIVHKVLKTARHEEKYFLTLKNFDYKKGCRVWREIDSFYENIIAVDTSINRILHECGFGKKEVLLYGIRYGSLELPIITAMLFDVKYKYFNVKYSVGTLCLKSNYRNNHKEELDTKRTFSSISGRLEYKKGCDLLLSAAHLLGTDYFIHRGLKLLIMGDGSERTNLEEMVKKYGMESVCLFTGQVSPEKVLSYLRHSALHVVPSRMEPFGLSAVESAALGKRTLVADTGGLSEIAQDNPLVYSFVPQSVHSLAEQIHSILAAPLDESAIADGIEKTLTRYNWDNAAKQTFEIYKQAIADKHSMKSQKETGQFIDEHLQKAQE